ncbi:MAG TPA: HEPN domain-containing protein [Candidatus Methylomirabilis sp.]|nr:HEPN domain-containing protein [Candidatus Methylomirabilis sp.]
MVHDPKLVADTRAWLVKAINDLRAAVTDLAASPPLLEDVLFHCQQAAEKAMKALLTWQDRPFRKTHDLVEIGEECLEVDSTLEPLLRRAAPLTEYAWKYRYPGEMEEASRGEAEESLALARQVYDAVLARLPVEVQP